MKKLLLLFVLSFCLTSCGGIAQVKQKPIYVTVAYVQDILSDHAVLSTGYTVPLPDAPLEKGWHYVFWLDVIEDTGFGSRKAVIIDYTLTCQQSQKNQEQKGEKYKDRRIIK